MITKMIVILVMKTFYLPLLKEKKNRTLTKMLRMT